MMNFPRFGIITEDRSSELFSVETEWHEAVFHCKEDYDEIVSFCKEQNLTLDYFLEEFGSIENYEEYCLN
jgi:hypothetical protein